MVKAIWIHTWHQFCKNSEQKKNQCWTTRTLFHLYINCCKQKAAQSVFTTILSFYCNKFQWTILGKCASCSVDKSDCMCIHRRPQTSDTWKPSLSSTCTPTTWHSYLVVRCYLKCTVIMYNGSPNIQHNVAIVPTNRAPRTWLGNTRQWLPKIDDADRLYR